MKEKLLPTVALIFGGRGHERDVSTKGAEYVFPLIDDAVYRKIPIFIEKNGAWLIPALRDISACPRALADGVIPSTECAPAYLNSSPGLLTEGEFIPLAAAFPLLHGDFGEDGTVQGALENAKIPFVGCDVQASAISRDKAFVKTIAKHLGIPTARWLYLIGKFDESMIKDAESEIGYPAFVKPARLGSSVGASPAKNRAELDVALRRALAVGSGRAIVEKLVDVESELECGYFFAKDKELFTNIGKISYTSNFYDYETKYKNSCATLRTNADVTERERNKIREYSSALVRMLGISGMSRIDFFRTSDGRILFNEINTIPGFTESSLYPRLLSESGISPRELVNRLISDACDA